MHRTADATDDRVDRFHPESAFESRLARIDGIAGGVLSGTILGERDIGQVFVAVNGRMIGAIPISWAAIAQEGASDARRGIWHFDARRLPPELLHDDRLAFEIRLRPSPRTVLDSLDIETARLLPVDALPKGHGTLEGYIDGWEDGWVRGWVWDPTNATRRLEVQLFVEGAYYGLFAASQPRPDLRATGRGDGAYGFSIDARDIVAKARRARATVRVISVAPELWDVPLAPHARARRKGMSLGRLRQMPATTRELAAILTSAEPFPKKIYVIDRLTQTMPDAFSADYSLLALEFLRVEMVRIAASPGSPWDERLVSWWRQRIIRQQIRRLAALAEAAVATRTLFGAQSPAPPLPARNATS